MCCQSHLLEMDAKKAGGPTWETVRYMVAAIQYGGRITDDLDQLLMDTYAAKFFHQVQKCEIRLLCIYLTHFWYNGSRFRHIDVESPCLAAGSLQRRNTAHGFIEIRL